MPRPPYTIASAARQQWRHGQSEGKKGGTKRAEEGGSGVGGSNRASERGNGGVRVEESKGGRVTGFIWHGLGA